MYELKMGSAIGDVERPVSKGLHLTREVGLRRKLGGRDNPRLQLF